MTTNATAGMGTEFKRGDGAASAEVFTTVAEINTIDGPNKSRSTIDVTSLDSTGGYREFIGSLRDGGEITLEGNFLKSEYDLLDTDFDNDAKWNYQIVLPDTDTTTFDFAALITSLGVKGMGVDDKIGASVTLKISGKVTVTP